jgi:hypothetical protein
MIADAQANVVFVSDHLPGRHPALADGLGRILEGRGKRIQFDFSGGAVLRPIDEPGGSS